MMVNQCTVKEPVCFEGTGLHTGTHSRIEILPAQENTGIVFVRKDLQPNVSIVANFQNILPNPKYFRRTSIGDQNYCIHTIEHLMAAFHILGVDNAIVNIWGEEVPGLDGSPKEFVEKILKVGIQPQSEFKQYLYIKEPIYLEENSASISVFPSSELKIFYLLDYSGTAIGIQYEQITIPSERIFKDCLYQARTFCLEEEADALIRMGLGKGANYDNTLVVGSDGIRNNQLRIKNEFVMHKILDLVGDLYLAGPVKANIIAVKSGHSLNMRLLEKLHKLKQNIQQQNKQSVKMDNVLSVQQIMQILPHRYPFLLVDKIINLEKGKRGIGIKNVTYNEYFFQGHFPEKPVMPGVLIIEAMAQVGGVIILAESQNLGKLAYLAGLEDVKFRKIVQPGDQLVIEVEVKKVRSKIGVVCAKAFVDSELVAEAQLMFSFA